MKRIFVGWLCLIFLSHGLKGQDEQNWVDSVYSAMSLEERVGQLLMIRAHSDLGPRHIAAIENFVTDYNVGGLCFFQGTPERQAELTRMYQGLARTPLLISMDAEWGTGMRFKSEGYSFPKQMTLGAMGPQNRGTTEKMGFWIGEQLREIGVHLNFAPVIDVNNNASNPVINYRSFGESPEKVSELGLAYMKGMHAAGVAACAKHFPGHGDTDVDSHLDLPVIHHSRSRLDSIELYPFKKLIEAQVPAIMVAHLHIPILDDRPNRPSTLSKPTVQGLLREKLGFEGLIITDAMEMKGVTRHFPPGEAEVLAIEAGNDMICLPSNPRTAHQKLLEAVKSGRILAADLAFHVKKVLSLKYQLGLHQSTSKQKKPQRSFTKRPEWDITTENIYEQSITCLANEENKIPVRRIGQGLFGALSIGANTPTPFTEQLKRYTTVLDFNVDKYFQSSPISNMLLKLEVMDLVFVGIHGLNNSAKSNYGLSQATVEFLKKLRQKTQIVIVVFGSPYVLPDLAFADHLLVAYEDHPIAQKVAAQMLFGARPIQGELPVSAGPFRQGSGVKMPDMKRLAWSSPESVGMNSDSLKKIDEIVHELLDKKAAPACQVLVARRERVVYHKAFGNHTPESQTPTLLSDVFDLASVTKVAATTLAVMRLFDQGKIDLKAPLSKYLPDVIGTNKEDLTIIDILSHQAGLKPWIPFYKSTLDGGKSGHVGPSTTYYSEQRNKQYNVPVADRIYMRSTYVDSMYQFILESPLSRRGRYVYSDLGLILMARVIHAIDGRRLDQFVAEEFYEPMGLKRTGFNPLTRSISPASIVPTEYDDYFRMQVLNGYVHDMGAAMLGGVSGHAGLFSNAQELAAIFQMLLNDGVYGGERFIRAETIQLFTSRVPGASRRGIGFDMKQLDTNEKLNMTDQASEETFGHLGFTGIAAWADPEQDLLYLFLSNRTYPKMSNRTLIKNKYRKRIHHAIYQAIIEDEGA
jgi:beta-glucosidase-like glycosyl hydrolase/CubicO group peptidase (beta-lactamase class C family)